MRNFRTKFNYAILGLRIVFFLFFVALFFGFIFYAAPKVINSEEFGVKLFVGLLAGLLLVIFLPYRFGKLLLTQRKILTFESDFLIVTDGITKRQKAINKNEVKGFSLSKYPTKMWNFDEIIIYLTNGDKIELPQFLYWNFKEIKPSLEANGLVFLGYERFRWKFLDSRYYHFD